MTEELSYEAARDELVAIVAKLEAGGLGLEESLKLSAMQRTASSCHQGNVRRSCRRCGRF